MKARTKIKMTGLATAVAVPVHGREDDMAKRFAIVIGLAVAGVMALGAQTAAADTKDRCTYGGAQALLHSFPVGATQSLRSDRPHLGQLLDRCQFRGYEDGETFTFREDDYILGGIVWFYGYEEFDEFGFESRAEAIEDLRLVTQRVEMATVTDGIAGPFEPVPLIETKYRDAQLAVNDWGHIVFNHRAFITQLPAGEYLVRWTESYPGQPDFVSTVRLLVTPD